MRIFLKNAKTPYPNREVKSLDQNHMVESGTESQIQVVMIPGSALLTLGPYCFLTWGMLGSRIRKVECPEREREKGTRNSTE